MRTLSNLIDKKLEKDKLAKETAEAKFQVKMQEIEKRITNQFEKAKYVTGKRLTMRKQHESMYYFSFDIGNKECRTLYICSNDNWDTLNIDSEFNINLFNAAYGYTAEEIKVLGTTFQLKDLNRMLIDWCRILTDKIIKRKRR